VVLKLDQGSLTATDNPLDVAMTGPGFFSIQTPNGIAYTRTGHLYRDVEGQLVTADGMHVLGQNGPIALPSRDVEFGPDGSLFADGLAFDKLQLVEFANAQGLKKIGFNRYDSAETPTQAVATQVKGGYLEQSNVDPIRAMTDLLTVQRAYEASQFISNLHDQMTGKAVNEVGKV
jgi:flagellar basal-body rod protein FlgG